MKVYRSLNHKKFKLKYHIIFSTKYRRKCLNSVKQDLFNSFKRIEKLRNSWKIEEMNIDRDHIHFLISATPIDSLGKIVKDLKQTSTYDMWNKHKNYLKQFYWSSKRILWTHGYFICTIGDASEETIRKYIQNQG